ncbi:3'-5' exonuclease [Spirillospora sp. NBC_01491]|uniref:3'-5' exonuclease n=1 Tax=Spirillospora sp. NBC_01491 TaxID=2976007 RepID=UPI002E32BE1A|nr:3'-5' exonuclease [Spirillospora sp. NBC_01491]
METHGRLLNVIDIEATCWQHKPYGPGQVSEIIEIGLCVVDLRTRERTERHRILVRPAQSTVSAFCTELTGLTQEEVDTGIGFAEACALLEREHRAHSRAWASWGDYDRKQFERQCGTARVRYPFGSRHTNAKAAYSAAHPDLGARRLGMDGALQHAGLPLEGRHHSGVDDAWNIGALVLDTMDRDAWPADEGRPQ